MGKECSELVRIERYKSVQCLFTSAVETLYCDGILFYTANTKFKVAGFIWIPQ